MADNDESDRLPTEDERRLLAWWNGMTDAQRRQIMTAAQTALGYGPSPAEVWNLRIREEIAGPPVPAGAGLIKVPPPPPRHVSSAEWRKRLRDAVQPVSDEEEAFLRWLAGWDTETCSGFLSIVERLRSGRSG
jgi:hypothetical protein